MILTITAAAPFVVSLPLVQFSHSVMSDSLQPHGLQHDRLPCPLPTPRACSDSCPSSQWCHPTISLSVVPFFLLPSILPSIRVFYCESFLHIKWPQNWSFSFSISPSFTLLLTHQNYINYMYVYRRIQKILKGLWSSWCHRTSSQFIILMT